MRDLSVRVEGARARPDARRLPDLYAGEPLVLLGRGAALQGRLVVSGMIGDQPWSRSIDLDKAEDSPAVARLWAGRRIADVEAQRWSGQVTGDAADEEIARLGLAFDLVTTQTSLVAVDETPARPRGREADARGSAAAAAQGVGLRHAAGPRRAAGRARRARCPSRTSRWTCRRPPPGSSARSTGGWRCSRSVPQDCSRRCAAAAEGRRDARRRLGGEHAGVSWRGGPGRLRGGRGQPCERHRCAGGGADRAAAAGARIRAAAAGGGGECCGWGRGWAWGRSPGGPCAAVAGRRRPDHCRAAGVRELVLAGDGTHEQLAQAPTMIRRSGGPNPVTILAAHRDTHFLFVRDLRDGDRVTMQWADGRTERYRITRLETVRQDRFAYPLDPARPLLALVTCYPFGGTEYGGPWRRVAWAERL